MKLWLLRPVGYDDRWDEGRDRRSLWVQNLYDRPEGFVVRANTESEARAMAKANTDMDGGAGGSFAAAWLDPALSICVELLTEGEPGIVIRDWPE